MFHSVHVSDEDKLLLGTKFNFVPQTTIEKALYRGKDFGPECTRVIDHIPENSALEAFAEFEQRFKSRLHSSILPFALRFGISGSYFIQELFKTHVDDDTLIIVSNCEHPSVVAEYSKYPNVLVLQQFTEIHPIQLERAMQEVAAYKKVFVYIIGTQHSNGIITPSAFFDRLKAHLTDLGIEYTMVLDAVQELFFVERDYAPFDYVLGTCHAPIPCFNMGMLFSRNTFCGYADALAGEEYLKCLNTLLKYKSDLFNFKKYCTKFFFALNPVLDDSLRYESVPYIYNLKLADTSTFPAQYTEELAKLAITPSPSHSVSKWLQMRAFFYLAHLDLFDDAFSFLTSKNEELYNDR